MKPQKKAPRKLMTSATFSEIPCWTRSGRKVRLMLIEGQEATHTGISLNTGSNFSCSDVIEESDVLAQDGLQISLANSLCVDLASVDPDEHIDVGGSEHSNTWMLYEYDDELGATGRYVPI
jgi:hypothetical protein